MKRTVSPGEEVPAGGIWKAPGRRTTRDRREVAPRTNKPDQRWKIVAGTRTNPGRGR
jgi:hypothetical protein